MMRILLIALMIIAMFVSSINRVSAETKVDYILLANKGEKWFLYRSDGTPISPIGWEKVFTSSLFHNEGYNCLLVKKETGWGLIDLNGKAITKFDHRDGYAKRGKYLLQSSDKRWHVFGGDGKLIGTSQPYDLLYQTFLGEGDPRKYISVGSEGSVVLDKDFKSLFRTKLKLRALQTIMAIRDKDGWGMINRKYEFVSDARYETIISYDVAPQLGAFGSCILIGKKSCGSEALIDSNTGLETLEADKIRYIGRGFLAIKEGDSLKVTDLKKTIPLPSVFAVHSFTNGMLPFSNGDGLWGYLNADFQVAIPPAFSYRPGAFSIQNKFAIVKKNKEYLLINRKGENVTGVVYEKLDCQFPDCEFITFETETKVGVMDKDAQVILDLDKKEFQKVLFPVLGKVLAEGTEGLTLIDLEDKSRLRVAGKSGENMMPSFSFNCYLIMDGEKSWCINSNGIEILPSKFNLIQLLLLKVQHRNP